MMRIADVAPSRERAHHIIERITVGRHRWVNNFSPARRRHLARDAMRQFACVTALTTLFAGPLCAQQSVPTTRISQGMPTRPSQGLPINQPSKGVPTGRNSQVMPTSRTSVACKSARDASVRLICADPDLAAIDSILAIAFQDAKNAASPDDQKLLVKDQLTWTRERNQRCGLTGKDNEPVRVLLSGKQCMEDTIEARIDELQDGSQTASISQSPAPNVQNVIITQLTLPAQSGSEGGSGPNELPTFQELHFSVPTAGISGTISCSAQSSVHGDDLFANTPLQGKRIVKIAIDDDANSYRLFENDTWGPVLDNLRNAVYPACESALKTGRLRNAANETVSELNNAFAVSSPRGLFMAYSIGQNTSWTLQINSPKARKKVKADLGIQTWVDPSQLARNPYFFKGSLVGMVIQFDRMLSQNDAVFTRPGAEIYVSGVPPTLFQTKELVVLAGRVTGNKGVISPLGSEALLPALDYVGAYKCGNGCENF